MLQNGGYNLLDVNMKVKIEPQTSTPLKLHYANNIANSSSDTDNNNCDSMICRDSQEDKQKATRFLGNQAVSVLLKWFHMNRDYPYPDEATTEYLAKEAEISCKQVKKWFANKRVRSQTCCKAMNRNRKRNQVQYEAQNNERSSIVEMDSPSPTIAPPPSMPHPHIQQQQLHTTSTPTQMQMNIMRQMAFYNPMLMMNMLAAAQQQQQQQMSSPLLLQRTAKMLYTNIRQNKLENSTGSTATCESYSSTTSESLNQSNLANDLVHLSSPYASSISSSSSSSNSTPNTQISMNSYNQLKASALLQQQQQQQQQQKQQQNENNSNNKSIILKKKFEKKINFACISSLVD